jgi:hypothetical protein
VRFIVFIVPIQAFERLAGSPENEHDGQSRHLLMAIVLTAADHNEN